MQPSALAKLGDFLACLAYLASEYCRACCKTCCVNSCPCYLQVARDAQALEEAYRRLGVVVPCTDEDSRCNTWAAAGECHNNGEWMQQHCRRACTSCALTAAE